MKKQISLLLFLLTACLIHGQDTVAIAKTCFYSESTTGNTTQKTTITLSINHSKVTAFVKEEKTASNSSASSNKSKQGTLQGTIITFPAPSIPANVKQNIERNGGTVATQNEIWILSENQIQIGNKILTKINCE